MKTCVFHVVLLEAIVFSKDFSKDFSGFTSWEGFLIF